MPSDHCVPAGSVTLDALPNDGPAGDVRSSRTVSAFLTVQRRTSGTPGSRASSVAPFAVKEVITGAPARIRLIAVAGGHSEKGGVNVGTRRTQRSRRSAWSASLRRAAQASTAAT